MRLGKDTNKLLKSRNAVNAVDDDDDDDYCYKEKGRKGENRGEQANERKMENGDGCGAIERRTTSVKTADRERVSETGRRRGRRHETATNNVVFRSRSPFSRHPLPRNAGPRVPRAPFK